MSTNLPKHFDILFYLLLIKSIIAYSISIQNLLVKVGDSHLIFTY